MDEIRDFNSSNDPEEDECSFKKHQWLLAKFILTSCMGTSVAIFGIFGNITTATVLTRPLMRTPNNLYLTALAIFDILVLILAILLYATEYIQEFFDNVELYLLWTSSTPYLYVLSNFAQTGSVYTTVSVTFERYLAVAYPKISQTQCTKPKTMVVIFFVVLFAGIFNISKFFEVEIINNENCTGFAKRSLAPSELLMNPVYGTVYTLWLSQFVMVFFPFAVLLTINTAIVWNFKKSLKKLESKVHSNRGVLKEQSRDATRVLVTIVVVFLICNCWGFVITVLESIYGGRQLAMWQPVFYAFSREAINFLAIVNSSINFLICLIFSDDFRSELLILYGCRRRKSSSSTIRLLITRRRRGFSERGRTFKLIASSAKRAKEFSPNRMRYVDKLQSGESLANYASTYSLGSCDGAKVPSFTTLIEAAHMLVTSGKQEDSDTYIVRTNSPIKQIEDYTKQRKNVMSNGDASAYSNGSAMTDDPEMYQPFLYQNNFRTEGETEYETVI